MDINTVFLQDMTFSLEVGKDAWQRSKAQPVSISLSVNKVESIYSAAASDSVSSSLDYGKLYKTLQRELDGQKFAEVWEVAEKVWKSTKTPDTRMSVEVRLPKAALRAQGGIIYTFDDTSNAQTSRHEEVLRIRGISCACIIGVNPHERKSRQMVTVELKFTGPFRMVFYETPVGQLRQPATPVAGKTHEIIDTVVQLVEESSYQTIEALANAICERVTMTHNIPEIEVSIEKPYAIPSIGAAGVRIRRQRKFYAPSDLESQLLEPY